MYGCAAAVEDGLDLGFCTRGRDHLLRAFGRCHTGVRCFFAPTSASPRPPVRRRRRQISRDPDVGGEGVRPQDHAGVPAVRVRLRHPAGAGQELRVRRERLELRQEQQKVRIFDMYLYCTVCCMYVGGFIMRRGT